MCRERTARDCSADCCSHDLIQMSPTLVASPRIVCRVSEL